MKDSEGYGVPDGVEWNLWGLEVTQKPSAEWTQKFWLLKSDSPSVLNMKVAQIKVRDPHYCSMFHWWLLKYFRMRWVGCIGTHWLVQQMSPLEECLPWSGVLSFDSGSKGRQEIAPLKNKLDINTRERADSVSLCDTHLGWSESYAETGAYWAMQRGPETTFHVGIFILVLSTHLLAEPNMMHKEDFEAL